MNQESLASADILVDTSQTTTQDTASFIELLALTLALDSTMSEITPMNVSSPKTLKNKAAGGMSKVSAIGAITVAMFVTSLIATV